MNSLKWVRLVQKGFVTISDASSFSRSAQINIIELLLQSTDYFLVFK